MEALKTKFCSKPPFEKWHNSVCYLWVGITASTGELFCLAATNDFLAYLSSALTFCFFCVKAKERSQCSLLHSYHYDRNIKNYLHLFFTLTRFSLSVFFNGNFSRHSSLFFYQRFHPNNPAIPLQILFSRQIFIFSSVFLNNNEQVFHQFHFY